MALSGGDSKGMAAAAQQIKEECGRYFNRMNQTDQKVQAALTEIKGLNENFDQKQEKLRRDIIKIGNVRNSVNTTLSQFDAMIKTMDEILSQSLDGQN
jgi:adenylosuccinate lyase